MDCLWVPGNRIGKHWPYHHQCMLGGHLVLAPWLLVFAEMMAQSQHWTITQTRGYGQETRKLSDPMKISGPMPRAL